MSNESRVFFNIVYVLVVLGMLFPVVLTLLPGKASKLNHMGYMSRCSFAPWSTISLLGIMLLLVGIVLLVQKVLIGRGVV